MNDLERRMPAARAAVRKTKQHHTVIDGKILIDPDMLVGLREMAERLVAMKIGYGEGEEETARARSALTTWIARREETVSVLGVKRSANNFPLPIVQLKATGLYDWAQVQDWIADYLR